jgi:hypothetical protein
MSTDQTRLSDYVPDPRIRGLLGGPVSFGEIDAFLPNNPQVVRPPFGEKSNPWTVMGGQSPQNIAGAMDENASSRNVENGLVMQYVARPFQNKDHLFIITGDIVFGLRSKLQQTGPITMLNLGSLNVIIRKGYHENLARLKEMKELNEDLSDIDFLPESSLFGERMYNRWKETHKDTFLPTTAPEFSDGRSKRRSDSDEDVDDENDEGITRTNEKRRVRIVAGNSNEFAREIDEVLALKTTNAFGTNRNGNALERLVNSNLKKERDESSERYQLFAKSLKFWNDKKDLMSEGLRFFYAGSIMDHWNFLGIVRSSTNDTGYANNVTNGAGGKGVAIAVTVAKKTFTMTNVFHNTLDIGDKLFLILKRAETGEFQFYPFSRGKDWPTFEDTNYVDVSGHVATGPVIFLGYTSESLDSKIRPQGTRIIASGLKTNQTNLEAYNAAVALDKLTVHVKIK